MSYFHKDDELVWTRDEDGDPIVTCLTHGVSVVGMDSRDAYEALLRYERAS